MKKIGIWVLLVVWCFSLTACVEDGTPTKELPEENTTTTTKVTEETFGLNETAAFKTLKFTATEFKESSGDKFFEPEDGNVFVGVRFTVENCSDKEESISSLLLFDGYVDDVKCDYSFTASCAFEGGTLDGDIAPSKKIVGWYALEVPKDWKTIELNVQSDWLSNDTAKFVFQK